MIALKTNRKEVNDDDVLGGVRQCIKIAKDEIKAYVNVDTPKGKARYANALEAQAFYSTYLPAGLTAEEVKSMVDTIIRDLELTSIKDMGRVMGMLKKVAQNEGKELDGKVASEYVKTCLS